MKVRMLVSIDGAPDGIEVKHFLRGQTYDLPPDLAGPWLDRGVCEQDKMAPGPSETKNEKAGRVKGKRSS
jgi:hypothetical protein